MARLARPTRRQAVAGAALGLTGLSAYAAARSSAGSPAARSSAAAPTADFIPSPDAPRVDGRLTLIWFSEPE